MVQEDLEMTQFMEEEPKEYGWDWQARGLSSLVTRTPTKMRMGLKGEQSMPAESCRSR